MTCRYKVEMIVESTDSDVKRIKEDVNIYINAGIMSELGNIKRVCAKCHIKVSKQSK